MYVPKKWVYNKFATHYALFFFYEKKGVPRENLSGGSCYFLIKIENFYQKITTFVLKSPSRTPFERNEKQCVMRCNQVI